MLDTETTLGADDSLMLLSQMLKASGDELRLEVLRVLQRDSFGVLELCQIFEIKQSGMSHHLKVLAKAGLVNTRKEGNSVFYQRATQMHRPGSGIVLAIFAALDKTHIRQEIQTNIEKVFAQRANTSLEFFSDNANPVKEQQDLIAGLDVYGERVLEFIRSNQEEHNVQFQHLLEVGPGTGDFLPALATHAQQITALDNSEKMLNLAREHVTQHKLSNVNFHLGDTSFCQTSPEQFDCAVINMVLHHTPSPQKIFKDVSTGLKQNGRLVVCDLCQHNQDWARETCGDMWLGFDPEHLSAWAKESGLDEGQSSYFALRNGFQIQIRTFIKN
ncbi:Transcriptional activator HlyU [Thalassocella blandensis]|nr:Transcriptional activator HlyU [Thalassocella blandensis]